MRKIEFNVIYTTRSSDYTIHHVEDLLVLENTFSETILPKFSTGAGETPEQN